MYSTDKDNDKDCVILIGHGKRGGETTENKPCLSLFNTFFVFICSFVGRHLCILARLEFAFLILFSSFTFLLYFSLPLPPPPLLLLLLLPLLPLLLLLPLRLPPFYVTGLPWCKLFQIAAFGLKEGGRERRRCCYESGDTEGRSERPVWGSERHGVDCRLCSAAFFLPLLPIFIESTNRQFNFDATLFRTWHVYLALSV